MIIVFRIEIMRKTIGFREFPGLLVRKGEMWRYPGGASLSKLSQSTTQVFQMMRETDQNSHRKSIQQRREAAVRELLKRVDGKLSQEVIEELKKDLGVSRATAYRMIKTFRSCGTVMAPSTRPVGRPKGARVLDPKREFLIHDAIRNFYLRPLRPKFSELVQEIGRRCREERLPPPNWRTIKSRVTDVVAQTQNGRR
jgi:DtxR family manganese transport transcriptional regulator